MLLLSLTENGNVNPNLDNPESNLGCLQALQFSIGQILFKLLKEEKRRKGFKKKKKKKHEAGKELFLTGCGMSAFAPIPLNGLLCRPPLVPMTAHLSSLCLLSFSELTEGPYVIGRGQPGVGAGRQAHHSKWDLQKSDTGSPCSLPVSISKAINWP